MMHGTYYANVCCLTHKITTTSLRLGGSIIMPRPRKTLTFYIVFA